MDAGDTAIEERGDEPGLLSASQAAELAGVDPRTVGRWARDGRLEVAFVTRGGHRRFTAAAVRRAVLAPPVRQRVPVLLPSAARPLLPPERPGPLWATRRPW